MRWVVLIAYLLATWLELFVFIRWPVFGVAVPLIVIMSLVLISLRWLDSSQLLLFLVLALFIIDSFAASQPGTILLSGLLAVVLGLILRRRWSWPGRFIAPVSLTVYFMGLWFLDGGPISIGFGQTILTGVVVSTGAYLVMYQGIKLTERRF